MEGSSLARVDIDAGLAFRSESCTSELKNEILLPNKFWAVPLVQPTTLFYNLQTIYIFFLELTIHFLHDPALSLEYSALPSIVIGGRTRHFESSLQLST